MKDDIGMSCGLTGRLARRRTMWVGSLLRTHPGRLPEKWET